MAARGYYQAFQAVKQTIISILNGKNPGEALQTDHVGWYLQMWLPFVSAGIFKQEDLIEEGSQHIPLNYYTVRGAMPVLFDLLKNETHPGVRAVLGHFFLVVFHPYLAGNGNGIPDGNKKDFASRIEWPDEES